MRENDRRRKPTFEEYADAVTKVIKLVDAINQLSQYYNLNQISTQYLNKPFKHVSAEKVANYFGAQYHEIPSLVERTQYNPVALVAKAYQIAQQIQPNVLNTLASKYGIEPEIVKSLQVYLQLAQVLPKAVTNRSVQVVNGQQYSASPYVLENY
jgi:hypothetical protein